MLFLPLVVVLIVTTLIYVLKAVKIVPESRVLIIERLGKYDRSLSSGLSFLNPFFDRVARSVSLKEQVVDFPPQPVITKDNATMQIDTVVYFKKTDPKLFSDWKLNGYNFEKYYWRYDSWPDFDFKGYY